MAPSKPRDERVAEAVGYALDELSPEGSWLVVDDHTGGIRRALPAGAVTWFRQALAGAAATTTPPEGPFDGAVIRLPKGKDAFRLVLHQVVAVLKPEAPLVVGGGNDEGIRPVEKRVLELVEEARVLATRRHSRVILGTGRTGTPEPGLEAWAQSVSATVAGIGLSLTTYPGLFAHGRLDAGTAALLAALPELAGPVLDFACGAGPVGQFLQRRGDDVALTLCDVDPLALHAAASAVTDATFVLADGLPSEGGPWKTIVSNPPLHLGKDEQRSVLSSLAEVAPKRLKRKGSLIVVVPGTVPAARWLQPAFPRVERVAHDASYGVWVASR